MELVTVADFEYYYTVITVIIVIINIIVVSVNIIFYT